MDDYSGITELVEKKLGKFYGRTALFCIWMAIVSVSINETYMKLGKPLYHIVSTHNFTSIIHIPTNVWTDILVVVGLIVIILIISGIVAAIALWIVLAIFAHYIILPIANIFKKRDGDPAAAKKPVDESTTLAASSTLNLNPLENLK